MITIKDNDLPITVAEKIINGRKPSDLSEQMQRTVEKLFGSCSNTQDMYSLEEIKEIADYLMVYYNNHLDGDWIWEVENTNKARK